MRLLITNYELFKILGDMEALANQHPSFMILNRTRVENFNKTNGQPIRLLREFVQTVSMKYCKKSGNGTPVLLLLENGQNALDFETKEDKEAYEKDFTEFMKNNIEIFT